MLLLRLQTGGAANPYVSLEVGDEKRRTGVETDTVSPVWDEEIMVFSEISLKNVRLSKGGTAVSTVDLPRDRGGTYQAKYCCVFG